MKNLVNFKVALKTREYLVQAINEIKFGDLEPLVVIDESLRLSKKFSNPDSYKFINACLDKYIKNPKSNIDF